MADHKHTAPAKRESEGLRGGLEFARDGILKDWLLDSNIGFGHPTRRLAALPRRIWERQGDTRAEVSQVTETGVIELTRLHGGSS
jgi:hypothetical protein